MNCSLETLELKDLKKIWQSIQFINIYDMHMHMHIYACHRKLVYLTRGNCCC
jgi:hypothetical protein